MQTVNSLATPLKTDSVVKSVLLRIEEALANKELKPGDFLPSEAELVKNLGVGKSSIREAVKMLEAMGVVEIRRGEGTRICSSAPVDSINPLVFSLLAEQGTSQDIADLRAMFEPAYTLMAMNRATDQDRVKIRNAVEAFEIRLKEGKLSAEDDLAFHKAILDSTHNPFVIRIGNTILQLFKASIQKSMRTIPQTALDDHKRICEAFCHKDETKLKEAIFKSFEGWKQNLNGVVEHEGAE